MSDSSSDDGSTEQDDESTVVVVGKNWFSSMYDTSEVIFLCNSLSYDPYNKVEHDHELNAYLNRSYGDTYSTLESIKIESCANPDLVCAIMLHFVRKHYRNMQLFEFYRCDVTTFFMHTDFRNFMNNNNNTNNDAAPPLKREIILHDSALLYNNETHTAIKNCSFFTSWNVTNFNDGNLILFALNSLSQNIYIRSLRINHHPFEDEEEEILIDSITNFVTNTKNSSKLELDLMEKKLSCNSSWTRLIDALIKSDIITDLSFESTCFDDEELLNIFHGLLKNKTNIRTLRLEVMTFYIHDSFHFKPSIFTNVLQNSISYNTNYLRELDFDFGYLDYDEYRHEEQRQEIISFFALIKDSCIEKLTFWVNKFFFDLYDNLFEDTIPFMSRLSYFDCSGNIELWKCLEETIVKSIGQCSRSLVEATTPGWPSSPEYNIEEKVKMILKRNVQLTDCIKNKTKFCTSAWPKIFYVAKPTGPDVTFHFLCNLNHTVGPDESSLMGLSTTTTEQYKRKL